MAKTTISRLLAGLACSIAMPWAGPAFAQGVGQDDEEAYEQIVVTSSLRQGGAQDISHFRVV